MILYTISAHFPLGIRSDIGSGPIRELSSHTRIKKHGSQHIDLLSKSGCRSLGMLGYLTSNYGRHSNTGSCFCQIPSIHLLPLPPPWGNTLTGTLHEQMCHMYMCDALAIYVWCLGALHMLFIHL